MASKGKGRATDAPYWGELPATVPIKPAGRRYSDDMSAGRYPSMYGQLQTPTSGHNRLSTNTMGTADSMSMVASPTDSSFQPDGLAPRPPSFARNLDDYNFDPRRRRDSRDRGVDRAGAAVAPPAAPEAPRGPPVSYREPYGGPVLPPTSQPMVRSSSTRRSDAPRGHADVDYVGELPPSKQSHEDYVADRRAQRRRASADPTQDGRTPRSDHEMARNRTVREGRHGSVSEAPNPTVISEAEAQRRREWAPDRSPLQRLELTLDSITKEEKRARVQEAEMVARARAAQGLDRNQGSVRFRDRPVTKGSAREPTTDEIAVARSISVKKKEQPQRINTADRGRPAAGVPRAVNGKTVDSGAPTGNTPTTTPQRERSFRDRAVGPATAAALGVAEDEALGRSNSNRQRNYPEGYARRPVDGAALRDSELVGAPQRREVSGPPLAAQAPPQSQKIPANGASVPPGDGLDDSYDSEDDYYPTPPRRGGSKLARMFGLGRPSVPPEDVRDPDEQKEQAVNPPAVPASKEHAYKFHEQEEAHRHHHPSRMLFKHTFHPGTGLYAARDVLPDWKRAGTAFLPANLIDIDLTPPKPQEPDPQKAWWEGESPRRRNSTSKRPAHPVDGPQDDADGMPFSDSSISLDSLAGNKAGTRRWQRAIDVVVPRARRAIGFYETSENAAISRRRNRSWKLDPARAPSFLDQMPPYQLPLVQPSLALRHSPSSKLSRHFSFLSRRTTASDQSLTKWVRSIRVPLPIAPTRFNPPLFLKCGPLLRYCGLRHEKPYPSSHPRAPKERQIWRGSVMIVTTDAQSSYERPPTLRLFVQPLELLPTPPAHVRNTDDLSPEHVDPIVNLPKIGRDGRTLYVKPVELLPESKDLSRDETANGLFDDQKRLFDPKGDRTNVHEPKGTFSSRMKRTTWDGEKAGKYKEVRGVRLCVENGCTFWRFNIEVELTATAQRIAYRINRGPATGFWVPARGESMNIMFYSCNGFSLSVNPDQFSGPDPLWRDVLNNHQTRPFHVMVGGGDQLYMDAVMKQTTLFQQWLEIANPVQKGNAPFTTEMQAELEQFYMERYCMWFSQGLFGVANSQIPMINIYDDHDIIDGFGSYPQHTMSSPVFSGLGAVAFKYYMLFQHQSLIDEGEETEPSWILGASPGPYIKELSRSVFMFLGSKVAFLGLDCRTERMRDEIMTEDSYNNVFDRLEREIIKGETKHLIVLLGVPIAYPRLAWLENVLTSRLFDPVKALGKTGALGGFVNKIDGGVEILDDLDDHWTAKNHKSERNWFIRELQHLAAEKSVRITILGGDVHLAAVGQFYSNPKLEIPKHRDFRYMPNVISSAIVNTPPPDMMADVLNKRNKVHHLDAQTDEDMIPIFTHDVNGDKRNNQRLLPRRNWCSIREYQPGNTPPPTPPPLEDDHDTPPPAASGGGLLRRLSSRSKSKGPSYQADRSRQTDRSKPPLSGGGGLFRSLSSRRPSTSGDADRPSTGNLTRTVSLSRRDFGGGLFRRNSKRSDSGGINGYGEDTPTPESLSPTEDYRPRLRGGSGDAALEDYFNPRGAPRYGDAAAPYVPDAVGGSIHAEPRPSAFHRTPTNLTTKQRQRGGHDINLLHGLDISINCEISPKDPMGVTVPYRLLVPALWYDDDEAELQEEQQHQVSMRRKGSVKRWVGLGR